MLYSECHDFSIVKVARKARPSSPVLLGSRTVVQCMHIANMQMEMMSMRLAIYFHSICMLPSEDGETYMSYFLVRLIKVKEVKLAMKNGNRSAGREYRVNQKLVV